MFSVWKPVHSSVTISHHQFIPERSLSCVLSVGRAVFGGQFYTDIRESILGTNHFSAVNVGKGLFKALVKPSFNQHTLYRNKPPHTHKQSIVC